MRSNLLGILAVVALRMALAGDSTAATAVPADEARTNALALLSKYAQTQDKLRSIRYVLESSTERQARSTEEPYKKMSGNSRKMERTEFRTDGRRFSVRWRTWGNVRSATDFYPEDRCPYNSLLWDGKTFINCVATTDTPGRVDIDTRMNESRYRKLIFQKQNPLWGRWDEGLPADQLLRTAANLSVRPGLEQVAEAKCFVLDARTQEAKYTVWIDPEHGHNIVKATINYSKSSVAFSLERVVCKEIDGVWIPVDGYVHRRQSFANGDYTNSVEHLMVTELTLAPDHAALRSFVPDDIKNGALVLFNPSPGRQINLRTVPRWRDGQVVDRTGRVMMNLGGCEWKKTPAAGS
jgi:hypothetical protein